jgi:hypothetical protein
MRQEFVALSNVTVRILLPEGRTVKAVHLVRSAQTVPSTLEAGYATVVIPSLHAAEIVHLELG